jgi:phage-related protein
MPKPAYSSGNPFRPRSDLIPVVWIATSRVDLKELSEPVQAVLGRALHAVQLGEFPAIAKPLRGEFSGLVELRANDGAGTYRLVYTAKYAGALFVLQVFQKKSHRGGEMSRRDVALLRYRQRQAGSIRQLADPTSTEDE